MLRFSEEDVIKLAKGVVEDPIGYCYDKKKMVQIIITVSSVSQQAAKRRGFNTI